MKVLKDVQEKHDFFLMWVWRRKYVKGHSTWEYTSGYSRSKANNKNIRNEETAWGQLMTYTRQLLVSHPWNNPIFSHPTCHSYPYSDPTVFKATYWLSTYYVSIQSIPIIHDSVSESISTYVCPESNFLTSLYPFPRFLSWLLISKTWSMFPLLIPFTHLKTSIISPLARLLSREWRLRRFNR